MLNKYTIFLFILLLAGRLCASFEVKSLIFNWQMEEARNVMEGFQQEIPPFVLGLYEFYSGNYKTAEKYFNKDKSENSKFWLELIANTRKTADNFEVIQSQYFEIRFIGRDKILALYLKEILDKSVEIFYEKLGVKHEGIAIFEIYPDRESFQYASTLTEEQIKVSGAIAICKFNRMMIVSPRALKFGYSWADTAVHEYIHLILGHITALKNMPLWLNEGLATYFEDRWRNPVSKLSPSSENFIYKARKSGNWVALDKMRYGMPTLDSRHEVILAFAQVQAFTDFLIKEYGWETMVKLLKDLRFYSTDKAFIMNYGKNVSQLKNKWKDYIKTAPLNYTDGAHSRSFAFSEDPVSAVSEWVSETARTDIRIAKKFLRRGNYKIAKKKYYDALKKDPGNSVILNDLAKIYLKTNDTEKAKEKFKKAIKNNPSYPPPYIHLAELFIKVGNLDEAYKMLMEYIFIIPFNPQAYYLLLKVAPDAEIKRVEEIIKILDE